MSLPRVNVLPRKYEKTVDEGVHGFFPHESKGSTPRLLLLPPHSLNSRRVLHLAFSFSLHIPNSQQSFVVTSLSLNKVLKCGDSTLERKSTDRVIKVKSFFPKVVGVSSRTKVLVSKREKRF